MTDISPIAGNTTTQLVTLALNAALAKHSAIATNIANANNESYRPVYVSFDEQVAVHQSRLLDRRNDAASVRTIESLHASLVPVENPTAEKVQIDTEVARMTQNNMHYQALLTAYGKLTAINRLAVTGGR